MAAETLSVGFQPRDFVRNLSKDNPNLGTEGQYIWWGGDLPPRDFWEVNPWEQQIETPTDEYGLVDARRVLQIGKQAMKPSYEWPTDRYRDDHLYWSEQAFVNLAHYLGDPLPMNFRNLPPNIIRLPLTFERWKHALTIPADFPSLEAMGHSVRAWSSAQGLFESIQSSVNLERLRRNRQTMLASGRSSIKPRYDDDRDSEACIVDSLAANFRGVAM